ESLPLVSKAPLTDEEFEASKPSDTRTTSSRSSASSDSTAPLLFDHPLTHVSPTPTPTRVLFHRRTARMTMRAQPAMYPGLLARGTEAMTLSNSDFHKRYRSSYETPSPSSSSTLPIRKRYRGTIELILDTETEDDESEIEGASSGSKESKDESPDPEKEEEEVAPEGQHQAVSAVDTAANKPLGLGYEALRCRELALGHGLVPSTFEIGQSSRFLSEQQIVEETSAPRIPVRTTWIDPEDSTVYLDIGIDSQSCAPIQTSTSPEWSSNSLPVSPSSLVVPSPIASPPTTLATTISIDEDQFLEWEQEMATVAFGTLWRPVLALKAWARHVDARRIEMGHARYDDHRLIHDLLVQNTMTQRELRELRDRVTTLEREGSHRGQ
nr:hypothetical protein [Tanacetum cinerariifolium]